MDGQRRSEIRAWLAHETFGELVGVLAEAGIPTMPLKGVFLGAAAYARIEDRPLTDVDVLVQERQFEAAIEALVMRGYSEVHAPGVPRQVTLRAPTGMDVDVHAELFAPHRYRLPAGEVWARGRDDGELFGRRVRLPSWEDAYAFTVGKVASDHTDVREPQPFVDLARIAARGELDPRQTAAHLVAVGVDRAARYTLWFAERHHADVFASRVLASMPPDPLGVALAAAARRVVARLPPRARAGAFPAHLLNDRLGHAVVAAFAALRRR